MGARQSKRSVDISAGATKAEKGPAGEPLENGTITAASTDEKQAVEVNGVVEETLKQNGSTPHIDEKETTETASPVEEVKTPAKNDEEKTEALAPVVSETNGDLDTTADESAKSPSEETAEVPASAEKKRKKKKSWSFRSISFSKKDKSKPTIKEQNSTDVKTETVPEVVEEEIVKEKAKPIKAEIAETEKVAEESPVVMEEKESIAETTNVTEIPPPLPSSPPPVETPAVPTSSIIETSITVETSTSLETVTTTVETSSVVDTPTIVETPAPVQTAESDVPQNEPEDDTVGGGEGLAEPPEGLNTSDIEKEVAVAEAPLVNGNHVEDVKSEPSSPDVKCLSEKIESIKLSNASDVSEVTNEVSNDLHEVNGVSDTIAVTNGDGGHDGRD